MDDKTGKEFSKEVMKGIFCRFCHNIFINEKGDRVTYGKPVMCSDCFLKIRDNTHGYIISEEKAINPSIGEELPLSVILFEMSCEVESDRKAHDLYDKSLRAKEMEGSPNEWKVKLMHALGNDFFYNEDKRAFIIRTTLPLSTFTYEYYPDNNRLLIREKKEWKSEGLDWLKKNVFPKLPEKSYID